MIRHVLPSNPSVQIRRQVESRLMGYLWGQSAGVGLLMGSKTVANVYSEVGDLTLVCMPLGTTVSVLQQTFSGVHVDKTVHGHVHPADLV